MTSAHSNFHSLRARRSSSSLRNRDDPSPLKVKEVWVEDEFGAPECCGCLNGIIRGNQADIVCNECDAMIKTVPAADLQRTLDEMELTLDVASEICPYCRMVNLFPGFSKVVAFTCRRCGSAVETKNI
jgi:hypothetical protein